MLGRPSAKAAEENETGWWSLWCNLTWPDSGRYLMTSGEFEEPFFNRAGFLSCKVSERSLMEAEAAFAKKERGFQVMVPDDCVRAKGLFERHGYATADSMVVFQLRSPSRSVRESHKVRTAGPTDSAEWVDVYLRSFYGDLALKQKLLRRVKRFSKMRSTTLLLAEEGGMAVGVTALFRSKGLLGLYCLGTLEEFRGRGVAHSLIARAWAIAQREGRTLFLQALHSEGAEAFYDKAGFERLWAKRLMTKPAPTPRDEERLRSRRFGTTFRRDPPLGPSLFKGVFKGFDKVPAVRGIFGEKTTDVLGELQVEVVDDRGYMHINASKGSIVVSAGYLKAGAEHHIYLDVVHELVHIRQHMEGKELWDRRYTYVDRPTELEAYRVAVSEARRLGLDENEIADYLKVEWVSSEDFRRFLDNLGVRKSA